MPKNTPQMDTWGGTFGEEYTKRNDYAPEELDAHYVERYGISRSAINQEFLGTLDRSLRILEVGTNIGLQLTLLQSLGFSDLYGIELQWYAVEKARQRTHQINILQGSALDLPFKDGFFDLVFTSGVLIHIAPEDIHRMLSEIHRCSRRYIWGFEYWAPEYTEVPYRGNQKLLWKTDFAKLYCTQFPDLQLKKEIHYRYVQSPELVDSGFLLEKGTG
jgi:pseudaminic acid biosynthesis-associated methylase